MVSEGPQLHPLHTNACLARAVSSGQDIQKNGNGAAVKQNGLPVCTETCMRHPIAPAAALAIHMCAPPMLASMSSHTLMLSTGMLSTDTRRYFQPFPAVMTPRVVTLWYRAPEVLLGAEERQTWGVPNQLICCACMSLKDLARPAFTSILLILLWCEPPCPERKLLCGCSM
eukprot:scaffold34961_cov19-Tisochrysis_lutea.AAC.1